MLGAVGLAAMSAPSDQAAIGIVIGLCVMLLVLAAALRKTG